MSALERATPRSIGLLLLLPAAAAWLWLHSATVGLGFLGDDYQWWQHARMAVEQPRLLFAAYGGFRLVNTWLLALDHVLWGASPAGYHVTNLALYLVSALLLWRLGRRLGLAAAGCAAVVSLWLVSPYSLEPSVIVSQRFEPVQLALWLGLALVWPGPGVQWSARRAALAVSLAALTAVNKESWVVLPAFTLVFDVWIGRRRWRGALVRSALVGLGVGAYLLIYARTPAIEPGAFFTADLGGALKVLNAWAAFSLLGQFRPVGFGFGVGEAVAVVMIGLLVVLAWRRRDALVAVGLAFFVLPFVPLLPVGWSTSRYTTIPLAGFLLALAGALRALSGALSERRRGLARPVCLALVAAVFAVNVALLGGDLKDYRRYHAAHQPLLAEARRVAAEVARHEHIVAVRLESEQPLLELARSWSGIPKIYFVRGADPYTLVDWSALFTWVLDPVRGPIFIDITDRSLAASQCAVLGHVRGGFAWLRPGVDDCGAAVDEWRARPAPVRVLARWSPE